MATTPTTPDAEWGFIASGSVVDGVGVGGDIEVLGGHLDEEVQQTEVTYDMLDADGFKIGSQCHTTLIPNEPGSVLVGAACRY